MSQLFTPPPVCQSTLDPLPLIIPHNGISLLSGAPNVGKTALIAAMARDFRDGRPIYGHQPADIPGIGVINADRGWLRGAGVWFDRVGFGDVCYYSMTDDRSFNPRSLRRKFERTTRLVEMIDKLQLPPHGLVIVDPMGLFLGGNLLDYDSCACACYEIRTALRDRDLSMIGLAHSGKLRADKNDRYVRLQDQILGSTALLGFSDSCLVLVGPEETGRPHYTFLMHSHLAPPELIYLSRGESGLFVPYDPADEGNAGRVLKLFPADATEISFRVLAELAEQIPLSPGTLKRVLQVLIDRAQIKKLRRGFYCRTHRVH